MKENKPYVIGISSPSGGGKTSVSKLLEEMLPNCTAVYFDEFDDTTIHPEDIIEWASRGGDYNEWKAPGLIAELKRIIEENAYQYLVFDAPLGRSNIETGSFIDFMVFVETPLDVAMARRFLRDRCDQSKRDVESELSELKKELVCYLDGGRLAYFEMFRSVKPSSDFIIDGCLPLDAICESIIKKLNENKCVEATPVNRRASC